VSFPAYPAYRESGVEWIGRVPSGWQIARLKTLADVRPSGVDKHSIEGEVPVRLCNYVDVYKNDRITAELAFLEATATPSEIERFTLAAGDVLITKDSETPDDIAAAALVDRSADSVVCGYHLALLRPAPGRLSGAFLFWSLKATGSLAQFSVRAQGITRFGLTTAAMGDVLLAVPPPAEQLALATFLDRECGKIDALVAEQERLIGLLKEKRQAVISHAVTKGLDPHAPMKDSGVEWLGQVPAHWEVTRLGYRYEVQLGRMLNEARSQGDDLRPYVRVFDVQWGRINVEDLPLMDFPPDARARYLLEPGDLLVNEGGSYVGRSAIWHGEIAECYYQKALHRVRPLDHDGDTTAFLNYVMELATRLGAFVAGGNQTTIDHLTAEKLRAHRFAFPPRHEQDLIAEVLEHRLLELDTLTAEAHRAIALLRERRAALISAAVTGKIDVRGLVAPEKAQAA
jgi:type I restriction enzyme S subunit